MQPAREDSTEGETKAIHPSLLSAKDVVRVVDEAVLDLWRVVDSLSRIRPPQADYYRVTIFGSARIEKGSPDYEDVRILARELARMGCDIVTGGGPGLMQAANEGEIEGDPDNKTRSFGIRIELPFEQGANSYVEQLYHHGTFFSRLHNFVRLSSAYVVVPGGVGTSLELFMVWQLLQVRQIHNTPLILVGTMWSELMQWAKKHMAGYNPPLASADDVAIPICVPTMNDAIEILKEHRQQWVQSGRGPNST